MESIEIYCEIEWGNPWNGPHHCVMIIVDARTEIQKQKDDIIHNLAIMISLWDLPGPWTCTTLPRFEDALRRQIKELNDLELIESLQ